MAELWSATLDPNSPRYEDWKEILGSEIVPLKSPSAFRTKLGDDPDEVYALDLKAFTAQQTDRLVSFVRKKFGAEDDEVREQLHVNGFPIREADVIVAFSLRAFL